MEDGLGDDIIWEIWGRREQGRTKYGRYGEEENRGGQNMGDMGNGEGRGIWRGNRQLGRRVWGWEGGREGSSGEMLVR